jgi:hypothetical protein
LDDDEAALRSCRKRNQEEGGTEQLEVNTPEAGAKEWAMELYKGKRAEDEEVGRRLMKSLNLTWMRRRSSKKQNFLQ